MTKRVICFDLDGTLINSGPGGLERFCKVAKIINLPMTKEMEAELRQIWGQHPSNLIRTAWPDADIGQFYRQWENLDIAEPWPIFPGTKEALSMLSSNFILSILTSRNLRTTIPQLTHNNIFHFFNQVIAADSSPFKKPDPRSIEPIFKRHRITGRKLKQVVFIGNTVEDDWKLAQDVGIEFFAVLSDGIDTREKFLAAGVPEDHIIDSVADLPLILLK